MQTNVSVTKLPKKYMFKVKIKMYTFSNIKICPASVTKLLATILAWLSLYFLSGKVIGTCLKKKKPIN